MTQGNLFNAPKRPRSMVIIVTRAWEEGDDVVEVVTTVRGTKSDEMVWSTADTLEGDGWQVALSMALEASGHRFSGALWDKKPSPTSVDEWMRHIGYR